jgi:hypothetical protein
LPALNGAIRIMSTHGGGLPRIANKYEKQRAGRVKESAMGDEKKGGATRRKG